MSSIDERIVKMTLDSAGFNKNAQSTISTLDKLKIALNFGKTRNDLENVEKIANTLNFNKLSDSVASISDRFSTMGIVGMTAIQRLTNAAIDAGKTIANKVLDPIAGGGWRRATKIDQARFKMEGLKIAWEEVEKQINFGVHDTAYGLDQAANAAAQLLASGVQYDKALSQLKEVTFENADDLSKALLAISGTAAMTSADYDLIADIFIDAAAAGKVSADTFNRISAQGLNAKATLSEALNATQEDIDKMSRKGQISFKQFADAMFDAYGEQATKSNETLEGALDNMKAALSRIGAGFATPLRVFWRDIYNSARLKINEFKKIIDDAGIYDKFTSVTEKAGAIITNIIDSVPADFFKGIADAANDALTYVDGLLGSIEELVGFFPFVSKKSSDAAKSATDTAKTVAKTEEEILEMANRVRRGDFGNGEEVRRKAIEAEGYSYEIVQNKVNELEGSTFRYAVAEEEAAKASQEIKKGEKDLVPYMDKEKKNKRDLIEAYEGGNRVSQKTLDLQKKMKEMNPKVTDSVNGLKSAFNILKGVGGAALKGGLEPIESIGLSIANIFLDITSSVGRFFTNLDTALRESGAYESIANGINFVLTNVANTLEIIEGFISDIFGGPGIDFSTIFGNDAEGEADSISTSIGNAIGNFNELLKTVGGYLLSDGADGIAAISEKVRELYPILGNIWPIVFDITNRITAFNAPRALNSIFNTVKQVPKFLKAMTHQMNAQALKDLAISVALIAGSFFLLAQLSWEQIGKGAVAITAIASALMLLWYAFDKIGSSSFFLKKGGTDFGFVKDLVKSFTKKNNAQAILYVAGAFAVLAGSMFLLAQLSWEQIGRGAVAIGVVTAALAALMFVLSKTSGGGDNGGGFIDKIKSLLNGLGDSIKNFLSKMGTAALIGAIGAAIFLISSAVLKLARIPLEDGIKAIGFLTIIFAELIIAMDIIRKWDEENGGTGSIKLAIIMAVLGLVVDKMGKTLSRLSTISWGDGIKALVLMGALFAEMLIATNILRKWTEKGETGSAKLILIMAVLSLIVDKMGKTLDKLSTISWGGGIRALVFMGALFAEMLIATNILRKWTDKDGTGSVKLILILGVLTSLVSTLGGVLADLSVIPLGDGIKSLLLVAGLFGVLLIVMYAAKKVLDDTKGAVKMAAFLVVFSFALGMIANTVSTLAKIEGKGIAKALLAIAGISAVLMGVLYFANKFGGGFTGSLKTIVPMVVAIAAFTAALYVLSGIEPRRLESAIKAITKVIRSLSLLVFASGKGFGKVNGKTFSRIFVNYVMMAALLAEIAIIFKLLDGMDPQHMQAIGDSMSKVMLALSALSASVGLLGGKGGGIGFGSSFLSSFGHGLGATAALDVLLLDIGAVMAIASAIHENFPQLNEFLQKGIPLLETLGRGLGSIVGGFLSSAIFEPIANSFSGFGGQFDVLVDSIVGLVEDLGGEEGVNGAIDALGDVKEVLGALGGVEWQTLIDGIIANFTDVNAVTKFADDLALAAPHLYDLADAFEKDVGEGVTITAEELKAKMDPIAGVLSAIGKAGWSTLGAGIGVGLGRGWDIANINKFCHNLEAIAPNAYKLAGAFENITLIDGSTVTSNPSEIADKIKVVKTVVQAIGKAGWSTIAAGIGVGLGRGWDIANINKFCHNLGLVAPNAYALAGSFEKITLLDGTIVDSDPKELSQKIVAVKTVLQSIGKAGWSTLGAGIGVGLGRGWDIANINKFCHNLGLVAPNAYALAGAFEKITLLDGSTVVSSPGVLSQKILAVKAVLQAIGKAGWSTIAAGIGVGLGRGWDIANINKFCHNLSLVAPNAYALAGSFEKITLIDGSTVTSNPAELSEKIKVVKSVLQAIGKAGWSTVGAGFGVGLGRDWSIANINDFCKNLGDVAPNAYELAHTFENMTLIDGTTVTASPTELAEKIKVVKSVIQAIGGTGWSTLGAGFGAAVGDGWPIEAINNFCASLSGVAQPVYNLAASFEHITAEDGTIITTSPSSIRRKVEAIAAVIKGIGDASWASFLSSWGAQISNLTGSTTDISTFAQNMAKIGPDLVDMANAFSGVVASTKVISSTGDIQDTVAPFQALDELIDIIQRSSNLGGQLDTTGLQSMMAASGFIKTMGFNLKVYSKHAAETNLSAMDDAKPRVQDLVDIANTITFDKQRFDDLVSKLPSLGEGVAEYSKYAKDFEVEKIRQSAFPIKTLIEALNAIDTDGKNIDSLGSYLGPFGENVKAFSDNVTGADFSDAQTIVNDISAMVTNILGLNSALKQDRDPLVPEGYAESAFDALEECIRELVKSIKDSLGSEGALSGDLEEVGKNIMDGIVAGMTVDQADIDTVLGSLFGTKGASNNSDLKQGGQDAADAFGLEYISSLSALGLDATDALVGLINDDTIPAIEGTNENFGTAISAIMTAMQKEIQGSAWRFKIAASTLLNGMLSTMRNFRGSFNSVGDYLMEGLESGINSKFSVLIKNVAQKTEALIGTMENVSEMASPSKRTMRIGRYLMEGLAIGINDRSPLAIGTAENSAATVIRSMSDSMSHEAESAQQQLYNSLLGMYAYVNYAINEALDTQPTITPVMDLSMIQNGANSINGMLSGYSLGTGSLSYARSMFPGTSSVYNNQANHQAISAATVQGIREDIRSLGSAISNMQMVLDSGTLVGSIGGGMDRELGSIQKLRERWA